MNNQTKQPHLPCNLTRREMLFQAGGGFGALALAFMQAQEAEADTLGHPHFAPKAKSVIWCFMEGGPSHIDLFDPKPALQRLAGQPLPPSYGRPITAMGTAENALLPSKRTFKQHGKSGLWVSDWYPNIAEHVDDMTVLRSCWADGLNHVGGVGQMNTGAVLSGRPSLGSWVQYGLGAANNNLPTFVVLLDEREPIGGPKNWSSGFLPAAYQGTQFRPDGNPILALKPPNTIGEAQQKNKLDFLTEMNRQYGKSRQDDSELEARIRAYELAFQMQTSAPTAIDISKEPESVRKLYGLDEPATAKFGKNCLMARRLVERGTRFVQLYCGTGSQWDAHSDIEGNHKKMCKISDKPVAGLIADLKQRGMLQDTLVIWGGEFGRTPMTEGKDGRDHNPWGFTMFMAGGGAKGGQVIGSTDEVGLRAEEHPIHVNDFHATILHLMGLNHRLLTYRQNGREERATVNGGNVVREVFA